MPKMESMDDKNGLSNEDEKSAKSQSVVSYAFNAVNPKTYYNYFFKSKPES